MRIPSKGEVLGVTAALVTMGGIAGCGGSSSTSPETNGPAKIKGPAAGTKPFEGVLKCVAIDPSKKWIQTPANMNAPLIARAIGHGVTAGQVEAGQMGVAACQQGIEASQVDRTMASVKGIGNLCIVVGLGSAPEDNKVYHKVMAVCAAEPAPTPSPAATI